MFALNAGQPLDADALSVYVTLWTEGFADLSNAMLEAAFRKTLATCKFWPVKIADIREQLDQAETKGFELVAETEWQKLLAWVRENVFPDTGIRRGAPHLPPAVEHAAKTAGGIYFIERCSSEELVWCRKNFLAAYGNVHETGQVEHLLGAGEAKHILDQLKAGPVERKQLPRVAEGLSQPPSREEVGTVLRRVMEKKTVQSQEPSQDEVAAKWREQKERARQWAIDQGLQPDPVEVGR